LEIAVLKDEKTIIRAGRSGPNFIDPDVDIPQSTDGEREKSGVVIRFFQFPEVNKK